MKFGLCHLVVIDDGTPSKGTFVAMCKALDLNFKIRTKRNHRGLTVEHFHRFFNKAVTIAIEDRKSDDVFVPAGIAAGDAWNSAHIDGTGILRSTVAICGEFRFFIHINLLALPQLTQKNAQPTIDYSRLTDSNHHFSSSILNE